MAHVVCLIQHYHTPDCSTSARPYSLIRHLARHHDVTLIASDAWRSRRLRHNFEWVPGAVRLIELQVPYGNRMGPLRRLSSFASYAAKSVLSGLRTPRPDVIFATSTPLTTPVVAAILSRWHGAPWVFEVRDLWPNFPIQMGAIPSTWTQNALYGLERFLYRDAAHVIGLSPDMTDHIRQFVPASNASTVLYGSDQEIAASISPQQIEGYRTKILRETGSRAEKPYPSTSAAPLVVAYAGSYGRANAIPTLIDTANLLRDEPDVRFVFTGDGYHAPAVQAASRSLPSVHCLPPLAHPEALALFAASDLSVVSFADRPVLSTNSPGKLFDSLTMGTPVIVTNPGWTAAWVKENRCGWAVPPESAQACAEQIRSLLHRRHHLQQAATNAADVASRMLSREQAVRDINSVVSSAALGHVQEGRREQTGGLSDSLGNLQPEA